MVFVDGRNFYWDVKVANFFDKQMSKNMIYSICCVGQELFFSNLFQWFTQLLVKESTQHFDLVENFLHLKVTRKLVRSFNIVLSSQK